MRFLSVLCLVCYVSCAKTNVKSLTESMGQEVIEIGAPIKGLNELPPDLDEEPSAEVDEDDTSSSTTTTMAPATKKAAPITEARRRGSKDIDKIDEREDDDARIEKELAEIYKDNLDYKDTPEVTTTQRKKEETTATDAKTTVTENVNDTAWVLEADDDKPIARSKAKDSDVQKLMLNTPSSGKDHPKRPSSSSSITLSMIIITSFIILFFICEWLKLIFITLLGIILFSLTVYYCVRIIPIECNAK